MRIQGSEVEAKPASDRNESGDSESQSPETHM